MKVKPIIDRLKAETTVFGGRVAGAAQFGDAVENSDLVVPSAFVFRVGGEAPPGDAIGGVVQVVGEVFAVVVAVDNTADQRGQAAAEALDDVLADLLPALLGWQPDDDHNAFEYVRDDHLAMNRARLWHQFQFSTQSAFSSVA